METADASALLLLDLPDKALAGIDLLSFTTTPRFKGVKSLPPGFHFAFVGSSTAYSERHGIWFEVPELRPTDTPSIVITRWKAETETLEAVTEEAEVLRWRANLGGIWREGLTPYRQSAALNAADGDDDAREERVDWPKLSSHITAGLLSRIIKSEDRGYWTLSSASSAKRDLEEIPGLNNEDIAGTQADSELNFLPIDLKQTWREGATGRERTDAAQDRSWALNSIINSSCSDAMEIVGELQFCFLMILTINNFSCLEHWKRILTLLFTCRSAIATHTDLFVASIKVLTLQLQHCKLADAGLIDLADEGGNLLKSLLVRFRKGVESLTVNTAETDNISLQSVVDELDDLKDYLRTEHGWQFGGAFVRSGVLDLEDGEQVTMDTTAFDEDDETGEYAPQLVELTPEQARLLGIEVEGGGKEVVEKRLGEVRLGEVGEGGSSEDEEEDGLDGVGEGGEGGGRARGEEEEGEEEMDLEDMDSRY